MGKWTACLSPHTKPPIYTIWWWMIQIQQMMMCLLPVAFPQQLVHWQYCNQRGTATARGLCTCWEHQPHCKTSCCPWSSARQCPCLLSHRASLVNLHLLCSFATLTSDFTIVYELFLNAELYRKPTLHWGKQGKQSAIQESPSFSCFHPQG